MAFRKQLRRTVDGKVEEVLLMIWEGVRIMRGTPHRDGPQGSFEKLDVSGAEAERVAAERLAALLAEGFQEIAEEGPKVAAVPVKASPRKPEPPSMAQPVSAPPAWMKKLAPPLDKQLAALRKKLGKVGLGHRSAEIEALTRPAIGLSVKKAKPADLKAVVSRMGGDPDLPADLKWPVVKGQKLAFVAQIVLADMKAYDLERVLPSSGVLSFFAQLDSANDAYGELAFIAHLPSASKLVRTPAPSGVVRIATPGVLTPKVRLTLPPHEEPAMEGLRLSGDEAGAYHDQVFLESIPEGRVHILGGWGSAATEHGIKGRRFCAQFDSDHHIAFEMGDYETLRFYVKGDAFEDASLKGAVCTLSEA